MLISKNILNAHLTTSYHFEIYDKMVQYISQTEMFTQYE